MFEPREKFEELRSRLVGLLAALEPRSNTELRELVQGLVPVHFVLRALGIALFPDMADDAARDRILAYFRQNPRTVIAGEELMIVSGIQEWARRVRELRTQSGWRILSGNAVRDMARGEDNPDVVDLPVMKPSEYMLVDEQQDREAAHRWHVGYSIRKGPGSVRDKIIDYLKQNVGKEVSGEELRYVADERSEWARRVRELRTQEGWNIVTKATGRPDLPVGVYVLVSTERAERHDRIKDRDRRNVLARDEYTCRNTNCGWNRSRWDPSDPRHLEVHHIEHHVGGGSNDPSNLLTLCNICHDSVHAGDLKLLTV